jgi:hypothetical protein
MDRNPAHFPPAVTVCQDMDAGGQSSVTTVRLPAPVTSLFRQTTQSSHALHTNVATSNLRQQQALWEVAAGE